jgi:hypothetical protein
MEAPNKFNAIHHLLRIMKKGGILKRYVDYVLCH